MTIIKRLEALERKAAQESAKCWATLDIPDITQDEWMSLVASGSDFCRADLDRVIAQRAQTPTAAKVS